MGAPIMIGRYAIDQGEAYRDYMAAKRESHARELAALNLPYLLPENTALALQARHDPYQGQSQDRYSHYFGMSSHYGLSVRPRLSQSSGPRLPINTGANRRMVRATFFKNPRDRRCVANG